MKAPRTAAREFVQRHLTVTPLGAAIGVYAVLCVPTYVWLEGSIGLVGTIPPSTALISLLAGSILMVPLITYAIAQRYGRRSVGPNVE